MIDWGKSAMSKETSDVPRIWVHPAILFFGCLLVGYFADRVIPIQLIPVDEFPSVVVSGVLFVITFLIWVWSFREYGKCGTPVDPQFPVEKLVKTGPCRFSRNPFYLALVLLSVGFGILMNSLWMGIGSVILFLFLHFGVVIPEEKYLTARFGEDYLEYKANVRRWI
jgi:protein-S-isoprenylcysteine O-methyltransferase Ste14